MAVLENHAERWNSLQRHFEPEPGDDFVRLPVRRSQQQRHPLVRRRRQHLGAGCFLWRIEDRDRKAKRDEPETIAMKKAVLALLPILSCGSFAHGPNYVVAIDVGHTRASPGAISVTGKPEYEFNLRIAKKLEEKLKEGNLPGALTIEDRKSVV